MLPKERQKRMRALIQKHQSLRISQLSDMLQVSEMTVHRDLKKLLDEGVVTRTYGGVEWKAPQQDPPIGCPLCGRLGDPRLVYRLVLMDQRVETACCSHCGLLRHHQLQEQIIQAFCQDFFTTTTISASQAWFVLQPKVEIGCCQPQVLCFAHQQTAERFIRGFGGSLHTHASAIEHLNSSLNGKTACHSQQKGESPC